MFILSELLCPKCTPSFRRCLALNLPFYILIGTKRYVLWAFGLCVYLLCGVLTETCNRDVLPWGILDYKKVVVISLLKFKF